MQNEKIKTIKNENIVQVGGYYRYINHANKLATHGFITREALLKYSNNIRFDAQTLRIMRDRYVFLSNLI